MFQLYSDTVHKTNCVHTRHVHGQQDIYTLLLLLVGTRNTSQLNLLLLFY